MGHAGTPGDQLLIIFDLRLLPRSGSAGNSFFRAHRETGCQSRSPCHNIFIINLAHIVLPGGDILKFHWLCRSSSTRNVALLSGDLPITQPFKVMEFSRIRPHQLYISSFTHHPCIYSVRPGLLHPCQKFSRSSSITRGRFITRWFDAHTIPPSNPMKKNPESTQETASRSA